MGCYYSIIWKGEDGTLSIPFNFSGYSNVTVAIKTYGIPQVVFEEGEFTIEDGFINVPYDENDFDLLPNGVLRYIVDFQVDGYDGVLSNNLNAVLKTPESYSAQTADEIWQDGYDSGYTDGVQDSGSTEAYENGFNDGHASGVTDGMNQQKSLMIGAQFNTNGIYRRDNGWNSVYVNVAQTGYTQQDITTAYNSGITEGKKEQKQLLTNTAFTINGDYTNENGWSAITVNIAGGSANLTTLTATTNNTTYTPSTGYDGFSSVHVEVPDTFDSGWTAGYESGWTDGFNSGQTDGYNVGWLDGEQEGFEDGYDSGHTDGFNSGVTYQKSLLSSTAITANGDYSNSNGWSAVSVNIAQTGYTEQDIINAFNSGLTGGFNSGWTGGYNSGYTDGYDSGHTDCSGYTQEDIDNAYDSGFSAGYIQGKEDCDDSDYLTFDVVSAGTLFFVIPNENTRDIEYRLNYSPWTTFESTGNTIWDRYAEIYLNVGDTIQFRGDNPTYSGASFRGTNACVAGNCLSYSVRGNIMSLVDSQGFETLKTLVSASTFANMFMQNAMHIISVSGLTLPATSLTEGCYSHMFISNSFEKAPELPAAVVPANAYRSMFEGCSNLNYIKCLASDISGQDSTTYWVTSVQTNSGTFVKNSNMSSWTTGQSGIPTNWTVQDA